MLNCFRTKFANDDVLKGKTTQKFEKQFELFEIASKHIFEKPTKPFSNIPNLKKKKKKNFLEIKRYRSRVTAYITDITKTRKRHRKQSFSINSLALLVSRNPFPPSSPVPLSKQTIMRTKGADQDDDWCRWRQNICANVQSNPICPCRFFSAVIVPLKKNSESTYLLSAKPKKNLSNRTSASKAE